MQEKLLLLRKRRNFSQKFVADELGLSVTQYGAKERGEYEFTSDEMFKAKELFGVHLEDIFTPRSHQNDDNEQVTN